MNDQIIFGIQTHLELLDRSLMLSHYILGLAQNNQVDLLLTETDNRERLINVVSGLQKKIEESIGGLTSNDVNAEFVDILKTWFADLATWSDRIIEIDRQTVECLDQQKEDTTKEIATIFKNKEIIKNYNHAVKK